MRRFFCSFILITGFCVAANAQNPVAWKLDFDSDMHTKAAFDIRLNATIEPPWHLYAIEQPKGGPIPTTISAPDGAPFKIVGKIVSPKPIERFDENFKIQTKFFEREVGFSVAVVATTPGGKIDDIALNVRF